MRILMVFLVLFLAFPAAGYSSVIRLSSTIGPIDAGIVSLPVKAYEAKTGNKVYFEWAGTGATLKKAQDGSFDMAMVHARKLEDAFVKDGYGVNRKDLMYNDFVILGPQAGPARIKGMKSGAKALKSIATAKAKAKAKASKN